MSVWLLLLLGMVVWLTLKIALDLPGLENHRPWVQVLGAVTVLAFAAFTLVIAFGWGKKPERSSHWWRLKIAADDILETYQPIVYARINSRPAPQQEQRVAWLNKVAELLKSQEDNPILLGNDVLLEHWRTAQNYTRLHLKVTERTQNEPLSDAAFYNMAEGIIKEVTQVQIKEIYFSDQPGAVKLPKKK